MMSVTQVTESRADASESGKQEKQSRKWHLGHLIRSHRRSLSECSEEL